MDGLRAALPTLPGQTFAGRTVEAADEFAYHDPVDGSRAEGQGIRVLLQGGGRIVFRLSGTGTEGATLRVYLEEHQEGGDMGRDPQEALAPVIRAAEEIAGIRRHTGREGPDVRT